MEQLEKTYLIMQPCMDFKENNMRLIDADKIDFNEVFIGASEFAKDLKETAQSLIDKQPTVEVVPVVHAEWRHIGGDEWCCSECGNVISTEGSWEKPTGKFCEECGADMRKKV